MATSVDVHILSKQTVRPSPPKTAAGEERRTTIDLTPWDLMMLSVDYIQKGLLFSYNPHQPQGDDHFLSSIVSTLLSSFTKALTHFYPLAGRLATVHHPTTPPSLSIFLNCNDQGAEFIHASAPNVKISDIVTGHDIPPVVRSFFPLDGAICHDGYSVPLLGVQVTELSDGVFVGCSLNHTVADGTSFWHFMNSWSEISRSDLDQVRQPPVLDRWFLDSSPPPIRLPYSDAKEFLRRPKYPSQVRECFFHFPAASIRKLKSKANAQMGTDRISSLQSLLAHVWLAVTRSRCLNPGEEINYMVLVGNRSRLSPPMPQAYLGNTVFVAQTKTTAGQLREGGLGWAAWQLNQAVASYKEEAVLAMLASWPQNPTFLYVREVEGRDLATGSSPRFDVYRNDFGWGRPVAVRSGSGNKMDGKATVYTGPEEGSIAMELCLLPAAMSSLVEDKEFMEVVGHA